MTCGAVAVSPPLPPFRASVRSVFESHALRRVDDRLFFWLKAARTEANSPSVNYMDQRFTLTVKQIHSLIEGNFYLEVNFGDNKYIGNLAPQYHFANGPTAVVSLLSPVDLNIKTTTERGTYFTDWAIAPDNNAANVVFFAKDSTDPFYLPMTFSWEVYNVDTLIETNSGLKLECSLGLGSHYINLIAHDTIADGIPHGLTVWVFTPSQAINQILPPYVGFLQLPTNQANQLNELLSKASNYFDQGNTANGRHEIIEFIHQIEDLHINGSTSQWILEYSKKLLKSID